MSSVKDSERMVWAGYDVFVVVGVVTYGVGEG